MRNFFCLTALFAVLFLLNGCKSSKNEAKEIAVTWELVSNFTDVENGFEARFNLVNHSDIALDDKNWALFFNMSPRPILANKTPQPATVQHINGDWYKMTPNPGFVLAAGDSVEVRYAGTEGIIKLTDAPMGLYFVFYDKDGKEENIVEVANFQVLPFVRKEQQLRGKDDQLPVHTAAKRYQDNLALNLLGADQLQKIVPSPVKMTAGAGTLNLDKNYTIYYGTGLESEAKLLSQKLKTVTGTDFTLKNAAPTGPAISLQTGAVSVNGVAKEAYRLSIDGKGVAITGSDAAGVFYGIQSLLALVPTENYLKPAASVVLGYVQVEDAPRFPFRSMHLDVSRNFQTKETVLRWLDLLAFYKINHFLFYLTEDEGWRIEIDGLPELTQVGGQRQHAPGGMADAVLHPSYGSGPKAYDDTKHGSGFYTKADFIEILKYANERHIKVIPELNFPGHARAAIKSMEARYNRLMKEGKEAEANEYRLIDPDDKSEYLSAQAYKDNVVSVGRESTYHFYEKVVEEITKMYTEAGLKLDTFHVGGDEVAEGAWTKSPQAAQLLKENPSVKDPKNLQAYFLGKLLKRLEKRNLSIHGWEEVALLKSPEGKYLPNPAFVGKKVVPYIWNNIYDLDLGNRLANAGYPVVLCNVTNFYFDLAYNNDPQEPGLYWGAFVDTRANWAFAPFDMFKTTYTTSMGQPLNFAGLEKMKPEARKNVIGLESQLWCETVKGRDMMEYYSLPKLLGFAESAWAAERSWETIENKEAREKAIQTGWNRFANSLAQRELPRLAVINGGYNYRLPLPGAILENGQLKANIEYPGLSIRYTTDGSEPTTESSLYTAPVNVSGPVKLKSFDAAGRSSRTVTLDAVK